MSSEKYREKVRIIDGKLAEAVGDHPGLIWRRVICTYAKGASMSDAPIIS